MALTVQQVFEGMPQAFRTEMAGEDSLVFQFHITGEEACDWQVVIDGGQCTVSQGVHDSPTVSLTLKDKNWLAMSSGELSGAKAFMTGKLKLKGDLMAAQKLGTYFKLAS
jgi:putative sterol carrier protein